MSELNFDFNTTVVETFESKYLEPGCQVVKVSEIKQGLSSLKQSPYLEVVVENEHGLNASQQYYLNTTPGSSGKSAMDITSAQLVILVAACIGVDITTEEGKSVAKAKIGAVKSIDELVGKISTICVGKTFAIRLTGKWINPTDMTKKDWIKAEFSNGIFAVPTAKLGQLKPYDANNPKDLKGSPSGIQASGTTTGAKEPMDWGK